MSDRPISDLMPNVTANLDDGDIVLDGMVLMRVINPTSDGGKPRLHIASTPDLDWMLQVGMIHAAREICMSDIARDEGDDA